MDQSDAKNQIDERTIMFSRAELVPGTERYRNYYAAHPGHLEHDTKFRTYPGLLKPGTSFFNPLIFAAADATFQTVSGLHQKIEGAVNPLPVSVDPHKMVQFITEWCTAQGAHSVGFTHLKQGHLYSFGGRKHNYGQPVVNSHQNAIAFTVEMDHSRVKMAPRSPIVLESSAQYLHAGTIAINLAGFIRNLGYPARAHIDGNYQVRCPQVARDAGLGEIGRMSLLMTPALGPRVRIAVVTTDIPLQISRKDPDIPILEFCSVCRKCAINCPAQAISFQKNPDRGMDWRINQEECYSYWCKSGTDCGRCISVCPYSHRSNIFHNGIRMLVRKSRLIRRIAVPLDNWAYGTRPGIRKMKEWMEI